jgi:hypothetical protein
VIGKCFQFAVHLLQPTAHHRTWQYRDEVVAAGVAMRTDLECSVSTELFLAERSKSGKKAPVEPDALQESRSSIVCGPADVGCRALRLDIYLWQRLGR